MPHVDETFYKMKCGWAEDPKVASLTRFGIIDAILARHLFEQMIDYCRRNLTDGLLPPDAPTQLMHPLDGKKSAKLAQMLADPGAFGPLIEARMSNAHGRPKIAAWRVLSYAKWNDTREEVQARTASSRNAAFHRWRKSDTARNAARITSRNAARNAGRYAEQEQEQE